MNKRKKIIWTAIGAVIILAAAGGCVFAYRSRAEPEIEAVITTDYVSVPAYTGRTFSAVEPQKVDDRYMDNLMSRMLETYNQIRGTDYESWTDEQVAYTTQGRYTSEAEWRDYLYEKYTEIEQQRAKADTGQSILKEVSSEAVLFQFDENDYAAAEEDVTEQLILGNGFTSREEFLQELEWSENEYRDKVEEAVLENLKFDYVTQAIAEAEGLEPSEAELMEAEEKYGAEEMEGWKRVKTTENVGEFLVDNNDIE